MGRYKFQCRNPDKYAGDPRRIIARSRWELIYMQALDGSKLVHKWYSEPRNLGIKYLDPLTKQLKEYWPDFLVQYSDGNLDMVEIKPSKQSVLEKADNLYDKLSQVRNKAKWEAASAFAKRIGARFRVVTEESLFRKKSTRASRPGKTGVRTRGTRA